VCNVYIYGVRIGFEISLKVFEFEKMCQYWTKRVSKSKEPKSNSHLENLLKTKISKLIPKVFF
jgi:hypothetical protein